MRDAALALFDWTVAHRRHLHAHPERSWQERDTSRRCREVVEALGYAITEGPGTGFWADLTVPGASRRVALRADMDALPMDEQPQVEFASTRPGAAHMCGHDGHMAMVLTAARLLAERRDTLPAHVRLVFQPSEEAPPGGALAMIEAGCLHGVDEIYGQHNDPGTEVGTLRLRPGPMMACADRFDVRIVGRGCHAARPQDGLDPIIAAVQWVQAAQQLVSRQQDPAHPAVLSVTQVHAGTAHNVVPDEATLCGTVRAFRPADRDRLERGIHLLGQQAELLGYQVETTYLRGYDPVINHPSGVARVMAAAERVLGPGNADADTDPTGWGEDFAYYLQHVPGAFFFLGSGAPGHEPLHSPRFVLDERCLPLGAAMLAELAAST